MKKRLALGLAGSAILACLAVTGVQADVIHQGAPLKFKAGLFCNYPNDGKERAPDTSDGEVGVHVRPYDFVHLGDTVPSAPDVSIGIIVQLKSYVAGERLTLQQARVEDFIAPDRWPLIVAQNGRFWFGRRPDPGKGLPTGHYQMSILRGRTVILLYEFQVVPGSKMPELTRVCRRAR